MAEDAELIRQPHGREQQVKMEIVSMIHGGESPYDIIHHVAQWLEKSSGEPGYAQYVEDTMRAVYGCALEHVRPMETPTTFPKVPLRGVYLPFML